VAHETAHVGEAVVVMAANPLQTATKTISMVASQTDHALLFYSCGKDSIMLLDLMAPHFKKISLCFMYFVKGLNHCDRYLEFSKSKYGNVDVIQVPHFSLTNVRKEGVFCNPEPKTKILKLSDIDQYARQKTGADWSFYGMKKSDGLNRRLMLNGYGEIPVNTGTQKAYPIADFKNQDVLRYIKTNKLPTPVVYGQKQSNSVGFNIECLLWMQKNEPKDLETFFQRFPKAKQILFEHEYKEKGIAKG
jgi:sulfate adenylyltransferase subunit 2